MDLNNIEIMDLNNIDISMENLTINLKNNQKTNNGKIIFKNDFLRRNILKWCWCNNYGDAITKEHTSWVFTYHDEKYVSQYIAHELLVLTPKRAISDKSLSAIHNMYDEIFKSVTF